MKKLPKKMPPAFMKKKMSGGDSDDSGKLAPFQKKKKSGSVPMAGMGGLGPSERY